MRTAGQEEFGLSCIKDVPDERDVMFSELLAFIFAIEHYFSYKYRNKYKNYWKENIRYVLILIAIWFIVSYGLGIFFVETLNKIRIGGFKLGFWFAHQGSIYVFVVLIFVYVWLMNRLDKKYNVEEN